MLILRSGEDGRKELELSKELLCKQHIETLIHFRMSAAIGSGGAGPTSTDQSISDQDQGKRTDGRQHVHGEPSSHVKLALERGLSGI
jgi:hypothetical protein